MGDARPGAVRFAYRSRAGCSERGLEPLFAVYRSTCLEPAREILAAGGRRPQKLLEAVSTRWVEGAELAVFGDPEVLFLSVNTPEDVERAARTAAHDEDDA